MGVAGATGFGANSEEIDRLLSVLRDHRARPQIWRGADASLGAVSPTLVRWPGQENGIAVLFDGILHNETEIRTALGRDAERGSAADLVAQGYRAWGAEALLDRLLGDFSFALHDGETRRLILARDALGTRPLFHWRDGARLLFASSVRALHAASPVPREIDPDQIARALLLSRRDHARTEFRGIERVPAGHMIVIEKGGFRPVRWWRPEQLAPLRLKSDGDYAEALRHTLDHAVAARLPAAGEVAVSLSGGLDSTAVAALAARRLAAQGRKLHAFTLVPASEEAQAFPGQIADEGPGASLMAASFDTIQHQRIPHDLDRDLFETTERRNRYSDMPGVTPYAFGNSERLWEAAARRGCKTLLGGDFGDLSISYRGEGHLFDLLSRGDLPGWLRLLPGLRGSGLGWRRILALSFGPALPPRARSRLSRFGGLPALSLASAAPVNPALARRLGLDDHEVQHQYDRSVDPRLMAIHRVDRGPLNDYALRRHGLRRTDPTADRRVIEFCLSIPQEQFIRGGEPRSLIRRAMRGLVPDAILDARARGRQGADRHIALTRARPRILEELTRMEHSPLAAACLDLPRLRHLAENWPTGGWERREVEAIYGFYLANGLAMGHFLRRFEGGNS